MSTQNSKVSDITRLKSLKKLLNAVSTTPIGDILITAIQLLEEINGPYVRKLSEDVMREIRALAARAEQSDMLFIQPPRLPRELSDNEYLQLLRIEMVTHELCYCCEMLQHSTDLTTGGSTPTRFYLNGFYHYASSLFLIDMSKKTHKDLPMGGTVIRALFPMGLGDLLIPIKQILDRPLGGITLGETILNLRHSDLVHGDFSPERVEYLIKRNQMRDPFQQEKFAHLIWLLFHRIIVLNLQLKSLLAASGKDTYGVFTRDLLKHIKK